MGRTQSNRLIHLRLRSLSKREGQKGKTTSPTQTFQVEAQSSSQGGAARLICIDLGSGLGGASAAFEDAGWDVVKIDIDRKFRPTIQADYSRLPLRSGLDPDVVLAAPDCSCFSIMALRYHWEKTPDGPRPRDIKTVDAIRDTWDMVDEIQRLEPEYAVVENPVGMMRRILGRPQHTVRMSDYGSEFKKPTDLWEFGRRRLSFKWLEGMGEWVHIPRKKRWRDKARMGVQGVKHGPAGAKAGWNWAPFSMENTVRAKSVRAKWPYGLSKAILDACLAG